MNAEHTLADFERMLDAEIAEATLKWAANNHDWQRSWDYLLAIAQSDECCCLRFHREKT